MSTNNSLIKTRKKYDAMHQPGKAVKNSTNKTK